MGSWETCWKTLRHCFDGWHPLWTHHQVTGSVCTEAWVLLNSLCVCVCERMRVCARTHVRVYSIYSFFLYVSLFSVGQVVNIKAKVNRAFNTSMEVREVHIMFFQYISSVLHWNISTNKDTYSFAVNLHWYHYTLCFLCNKHRTHKSLGIWPQII